MTTDLWSVVEKNVLDLATTRSHLGAVLVALFALAAIIVLAVAHVAYWRRRFYVAADYQHEHVIDTEDGCTIVLRRLPRPDGDIVGPPASMVHGLCANHRNNDLVPDHQLDRTPPTYARARRLARHDA